MGNVNLIYFENPEGRNDFENLGNRRNVVINPLKAELNPICHLVALLGAHHILHVSRIKVKIVCNLILNRCNGFN